MISVLTQRALKFVAIQAVRTRTRFLGRRVPDPTIPYFAFGANLEPRRFEKYGMNVRRVGVARLPGYRFAFSLPCEYAGKGFGSIEPNLGSEVWGVLYKVDWLSLFLLDVMEWAVMGQYRRVPVEGIDVVGNQVAAFAYRARYPRFDLVPSNRYKTLVVDAGRQLGFPSTY